MVTRFRSEEPPVTRAGWGGVGWGRIGGPGLGSRLYIDASISIRSTSISRERERSQPSMMSSCLKVLIGDEPEEGMENLLEVEVPEEVEERLKQAEQKEEEENKKEMEETGEIRKTQQIQDGWIGS